MHNVVGMSHLVTFGAELLPSSVPSYPEKGVPLSVNFSSLATLDWCAALCRLSDILMVLLIGRDIS